MENTTASVSAVPLSRVLVATDFSLNAARAVTRAVQLPLARGAALLLVHILSEQAPGRFGERLERVTRTALRKEEARMRLLAKEAGRQDLVIRCEVISGDPVEAMANLCAADRMELVVLGRHGRRTFKDQLLGTTAEKLIRAASVPVLVVGRTRAGNYRRPLFAADLRPENRRALEALLRVTGGADGRLVQVVHAYEQEQDLVRRAARGSLSLLRRERLEAAEAGLRAFVAPYERAGVGFRMLLDARDPRTALPAAAQSFRADLLVLGTQARTGTRRLLLGSVAESALRRVSCDVLVVRTPAPLGADDWLEKLSRPDDPGSEVAPSMLLSRPLHGAFFERLGHRLH